MSKADIEIVKGNAPVREFRVEDRNSAPSSPSATIKAGEPVKVGGTENNYVILCANGDPEIGTDRFVGIAQSESTETASAAGTVNVYVAQPGETIFRAKANTSTNIDTDAELRAILNDSVTFDYDGTDFTVDEDEGDDPDVHGLVVVDGDIDKGTLDFTVKPGATLHGNEIS